MITLNSIRKNTIAVLLAAALLTATSSSLIAQVELEVIQNRGPLGILEDVGV